MFRSGPGKHTGSQDRVFVSRFQGGKTLDIEDFLADLSSGTPSPGGGSAAAMAAALSASLMAMVAGLSVKRADRPRAMEALRKKALSLQARMYAAVSRDAASFDAVMDAFRLPKETGEERLRRDRAIQKAYRVALVVPSDVAKCSLGLIGLCDTLLLHGNPNAKPDATVGFHLANAAFEGAVCNIRANLDAIREGAFKKKMGYRLQRLLQDRAAGVARVMKQLQTPA
jgi:methenyltetrahydrofolate cyclohydrolase